MDWFDILADKTSHIIGIEPNGYVTKDGTDPNKILMAGWALDIHKVEMRDEIIRLRKLLGASEMINTHSSLDEK